MTSNLIFDFSWLFNIIQLQVGALPQPADLERQRERIMAEAWSALKRCGLNMFEHVRTIRRASKDCRETACTMRLRVWDAVDFSNSGPAGAKCVELFVRSAEGFERATSEGSRRGNSLALRKAMSNLSRSQNMSEYFIIFIILRNNNRANNRVHVSSPDFQPFATAVVWTSLNSRDKDGTT